MCFLCFPLLLGGPRSPRQHILKVRRRQVGNASRELADGMYEAPERRQRPGRGARTITQEMV